VETNQAAREDKVFEIINKVLQRTVGDQAASLIYANLEQRYSLKQHEISGNIDVFSECLEDILKEAALPIENFILNDILSICGFNNAVTFEIAVPEEPRL
jgi:serine phosphatase RsbU (regulator of sigma subunit)